MIEGSGRRLQVEAWTRFLRRSFVPTGPGSRFQRPQEDGGFCEDCLRFRKPPPARKQNRDGEVGGEVGGAAGILANVAALNNHQSQYLMKFLFTVCFSLLASCAACLVAPRVRSRGATWITERFNLPRPLSSFTETLPVFQKANEKLVKAAWADLCLR